MVLLVPSFSFMVANMLISMFMDLKLSICILLGLANAWRTIPTLFQTTLRHLNKKMLKYMFQETLRMGFFAKRMEIRTGQIERKVCLI